MIDESPTTPFVVPLATPEDFPLVRLVDSLSQSPTRDIHRDMEKYFGSVDPSTHERILIFLGEVDGVAAAKAELMLPPPDERSTPPVVGYVKRVVVHPDFRKQGLARQLMQHIIAFARSEQQIDRIGLSRLEGNVAAVRVV